MNTVHFGALLLVGCGFCIGCAFGADVPDPRIDRWLVGRVLSVDADVQRFSVRARQVSVDHALVQALREATARPLSPPAPHALPRVSKPEAAGAAADYLLWLPRDADLVILDPDGRRALPVTVRPDDLDPSEQAAISKFAALTLGDEVLVGVDHGVVTSPVYAIWVLESTRTASSLQTAPTKP